MIEAPALQGIYRSRTGLDTYDQALWLQPPPRVDSASRSSSGLDFVRQIGHSAKPEVVQEVTVDIGEPQILLMPEGSQGVHWHTDRGLHCVAGGSGIIIMAPGRSRFVCQPTSAEVLHFHFQPHVLTRLAPDVAEPEFVNRFEEPDFPLSRLMQAFYTDVARGCIGSLLLESYALLFLRRLVLAKRQTTATGGLAPWQVRRTSEYLKHHLEEEVSLCILAELVNLSPFHFARSFKRSVGIPPHAYLHALRLQEAKRLLTLTQLPITQIAAQVGYASSQAFARAFHRGLGMTPTQYRRERLR